MDYSLPGSSLYGILQARILEWVAISFSRGSGIQPMSPALAGGFFTTEIFFFLKSPYLLKVKVLATQSCLTLCDSMDCCPPGSSVHGILQARILEGLPGPPPGDFPTQGLSPGFLHHERIFYHLSHQDVKELSVLSSEVISCSHLNFPSLIFCRSSQ